MAQNLPQLLAPGAQARGLDLKALLAIAGHEGASGRIGDNGHAFGPFQLNDAGGVLTGKLAGLSPEQKNQWAWSPAGIKFAEDGIARVASGLHGADAVKAIASKFERPANVNAEIGDALAHYGSAPTGALASAGAPRNPSSGAAPGGLLGSLLSAGNEAVGLDLSPLLGDLLSAPERAQPSATPTVRAATGQGTAPKFSNVDGVTVDSMVAPAVASVDRQFGVHPSSGLRSAQHNAQVGGASNSDHLRGDAVDFVGNPSQLAALYRFAQGRFPYVEPMAQAKDHVHVSFRR